MFLDTPINGSDNQSLVLMWTNKDRYKDGSIKNDLSIDSICYFRDVRKYVTKWRNKEGNEHGSFTSHSNDEYNVSLLAGNMHKCSIDYTDGRKYVGGCKNHKPNGRGVLTWPDGHRYEGSFLNGDRHDHGTYNFGNEAPTPAVGRTTRFMDAVCSNHE